MGAAGVLVEEHDVAIEDKCHHVFELKHGVYAADEETPKRRELVHVLYFHLLVVELYGVVLCENGLEIG